MAAIEACVTSATFEKITAAQVQLPREQRQNIEAVLDVIATVAKAKDNVWVYTKAFDAYKQQTIVVPSGGAGGQFPPKFLRFGQNLNFSGSDKKIFGQNQNFSGSDMKNLGKVTKFRAVTMINCKI